MQLILRTRCFKNLLYLDNVYCCKNEVGSLQYLGLADLYGLSCLEVYFVHSGHFLDKRQCTCFFASWGSAERICNFDERFTNGTNLIKTKNSQSINSTFARITWAAEKVLPFLLNIKYFQCTYFSLAYHFAENNYIQIEILCYCARLLYNVVRLNGKKYYFVKIWNQWTIVKLSFLIFYNQFMTVNHDAYLCYLVLYTKLWHLPIIGQKHLPLVQIWYNYQKTTSH